MRDKHRTAPAASKSSVVSVEDEVAHLRDLDLKGLRARWQSIFQRPPPHGAIAESVDRIDVYKDRLAIRLRSQENPGTINLGDKNEPTDDRLLSISWQKPPSKRFREILLPYGSSRKEGRPERPERRLRLVSAIARGRLWLDEILSGSVTDAERIALRERCSARHINMTISLAFLAPKLVRAAVEGRLPRGINIERLRDVPVEWSRQFEALGLNPHQ